MKEGYHSTQRKIWGTVPASEFYGFLLGYGTAMIIKGLLRLDNTFLPLLCGAAGALIGMWVDRKFYMVKDDPPEESAEPEDPVENINTENAVPEGASTQETLRIMFERNRNDTEQDPAED